ncbi:hypothetical protein D3C77_415000 [compost metagenome]
MAAAGGLVSIGWDVQDSIGELDRNTTRNNLLATAYGARAIATISLLIGHGGIAFSQAGAYFGWLAMQARNTGQEARFLTLARLSTRLTTNQTAMLLLGRMSWIGGAIVLGATVILMIIDESALEKWCSQCCFSRNTETKKYKNDSDELGALFDAINEVV